MPHRQPHNSWKMNLYRPWQIRACFCWITEKSQIIQLKISFHDDNFRMNFFEKANFIIFNVDLFRVNLNIFCGIIWIEIQISIACLEKTFLLKFVSNRNWPRNPVEHLQWSFFTKLVNSSEAVTRRCSASVKRCS